MNRRSFLKAIAVSPFVGLTGPQKTTSNPGPADEVSALAFAPTGRHSIVADRLWERYEPPVIADGLRRLILADDLPSGTIIGGRGRVEISIDGITWHLIGV